MDAFAKRFFMNGDEWGLYEILPAENIDHCRKISAASRGHHKDTVFSSTGWTTPPYIIPPAPISILSRNIRVLDLEAILGIVMPRAAGVDSCEDSLEIHAAA